MEGRLRGGARVVTLLVAFASTLPVACRRERVRPHEDAAAAAPAPLATAAPAFARTHPKVGDVRTERARTHVKLAVTLTPPKGSAAQAFETDREETEERTEEVLEVTDNAARKLRVTYIAKSTRSVSGDKVRTDASALAGRQFVVEATPTGVTVRDPTGPAVAAADVEAVAKTYAALGQPDAVAAAVPAAPIEPGAQLPELAAALAADATRAADGFVVQSSQVTFGELTADAGRFDVALTLTWTTPPMAFSVPLKGALRVRRADGRAASIELAAPITVAATEGVPASVRISGGGTLEMSLTSTPR